MIHYFNPGHEVAVLNSSPFYMAPTNVQTMQQDLAFLPAWYAKSNDFVFLHRELNDSFRKTMDDFNLDIIPFTEKEITTYSDLREQDLQLWGISPQSLNFWQQISEKYTLDLNISDWNTGYKYLCSRNFSSQILKEISDIIPFIQKEIQPVQCSSIRKIEYLLSVSPNRLLAKAPFSSSGRGLLWLPEKQLAHTELQILSGILKKQEYVTVEPVLNKKVDFAMEFMIKDKHIDFVGYSVFATNNKGAYLGNYLESQDRLLLKLSKYIEISRLNIIQENLTKLLIKHIYPIYEGCVGVDMMIYEECGTYHIHPCLEINMRFNMGYLSICLYNRFVHKDSSGFFKIDYIGKNIDILSSYNSEINPVFIDNKLARGYKELCPITSDSKYSATMIIEKIID